MIDRPVRTRTTRRRSLPSRVVAGSLYAISVVVAAALAAWPIYRSSAFLVLVVVAAVAGAGIAVAATLRRWSGWLSAGVLAVAFVILGIPLAVPSRLGGPVEVARGLGELVAGAAVGWKDLVTVDLPVGAYRNLLVPALVVFLLGTCALLLLSWRTGRRAYIAVPIALAMISFGLFFGRSEVGGPVSVGPVTLYAPRETVLGVAVLLSSLLWLAWRAYDDRVRALQRAAVASGVRVSRHATPADRRRVALGVGMIAASVAVAVAVVPFAARGADRDVLRSAIGPEIDLSAEVSPLARYRALFEDERAPQVLFTVDASADAPQRVRLATLTEYDGEVFRVGEEGVAGRFVRVPAERDAGSGRAIELSVSIDQWNEVWMPTAGSLTAVRFSGPRATALADGFYYSVGASAGVQTAGGGLAPGDSYRLWAVAPDEPALGEIEAPGVPDSVPAPDSLRAWVDEHVSGAGGSALEGLVTLLRERGYLSHGLTLGEDETAVWASGLDGYDFQPSASGHSLARIDRLFSRLLEREADPRAAASGNYVAAIGDDEQFAVAVALIARELGFPSRVVIGARLGEPQPGLAGCADGICRAQDLAAWTEVQSDDGRWVPIDVTPQYAQSPSLEVTQQRDPEIVTDVRPDPVEEIVPPDPVRQDALTGDDGDEGEGIDLAWLLPAVRIVGIVLLILLLALGPFVAVVIAKAVRRRERRRAGDAATRIAAGWDELVDAAVDARVDVPRAATRVEIAEILASSSAVGLARSADRAVFGGADAGLTEEDADRAWREVDDERRDILRRNGTWHRALATVSLRSIVRPLAPERRAGMLFAERGRRPSPRPARSTT